jgi:hypothetical protein
VRYSDFEYRIKQMALSSSGTARHQFAFDTIERLCQSAQQAIINELTNVEQCLLAEILLSLETIPAVRVKRKLQELCDSMERDPVRAMEFHCDITELLCAIDNWLDYRSTADPLFIAGLAINMVNSIDHLIGGAMGEYSIDNIRGAPQMREEFERQKRLLGCE